MAKKYNRKNKIAFPIIGIIAWIINACFAGNAQAATTTATMAVSATVVASCTVSVTPLAFGSYQFTATSQGTSTITLQCTDGDTYSIGLSAGTTTGATVTARKMTGPTVSSTVQYLNYGLYQDSAHTINWGNTPGTDTPATATCTGNPTSITIYGQIPQGQTSGAGSYTDTITLTVNY